MANINLVIIEDEDDIRNGLISILEATQGFAVLADFDNAEEAVKFIKMNAVDVALFDIQLPGISGIEAIAHLKSMVPGTQYLIISSYDDTENIFEALRVGATGYLVKNTPPSRLIDAIQEIVRGGSPMNSQIARKVVMEFSKIKEKLLDLDELSERENEILKLLSTGLRYKEIAAKLFLSTDTVRTHIRNIYSKLQVSCKQDAVKYMKDRGK